VKVKIKLKEFCELTSESIEFTEPSALSNPNGTSSTESNATETVEGFREKLQRRCNTPFVSNAHFHRWGINE
jgi:hypothetical protein